MNQLFTTFKPGTGTTNSISLYVNNLKTNIYYFTTLSGGKSVEAQQKEAFAMQRLIERGAIYPEDGNWEGFDICASSHFTIDHLKIIDFVPPYSNKLFQATVYYRLAPTDYPGIIASHLGKTEWTQYCKRLVEDRISNRLGILFGNFGYAVYFI